MALALARFCRVVATTAFVFGLAAALRPLSLLAQTRATIQASATILPAQTAVETDVATLAAGLRAARAPTTPQPEAPVVVAGSRRLVMISTEPQAQAIPVPGEQRQRSVKLRVEYTAN